jgi:hypothetical protein
MVKLKEESMALKKKVRTKKVKVVPLAYSNKLDEMQELFHDQNLQFQEMIDKLVDKVNQHDGAIDKLALEGEKKYILWFETDIDEEKKKKIEKALADLGVTGVVLDGVKQPGLICL